MSCKVRTPDQGRAKRDVRRAAKWYERQRQGLGKEFVVEVDAALERIAGNPEQYDVVHREIRHRILRRFPYGVIYRIQANKISVFAIVHLKRDDILWNA